MAWQPNSDDLATVSNSQNWMQVLTDSTVYAMNQDMFAAETASNAATLFGNVLMQYITWANNYASKLMNGDPDKHGTFSYCGERDKGMDSDSSGTSSIMNQFSTANENWEMLMKNSATSDASTSNNLMQQESSIGNNGDPSQQGLGLSSLLSNPD